MGWLTFDRADFTLIRGVPGSFVSSPGVVRTFCTVCGTPLTYASEDYPGEIDVTTISLDDELLFPPSREEWVSHKVTWQMTDPTRAQYSEGAGDGH